MNSPSHPLFVIVLAAALSNSISNDRAGSLRVMLPLTPLTPGACSMPHPADLEEVSPMQREPAVS